MSFPLETKNIRVNKNYPTEALWCLNIDLTGTIISLLWVCEYHTVIYCCNTKRILHRNHLKKKKIFIQVREDIGKWAQADEFHCWPKPMTLTYFHLTHIYYH